MKLNLYYERQESGWSQGFVADNLKISRPYYSMVEAGSRTPSLSLVRKLETMFDHSYDYLLSVRGSEKGEV